jgi:hypothetical protein
VSSTPMLTTTSKIPCKGKILFAPTEMSMSHPSAYDKGSSRGESRS